MQLGKMIKNRRQEMKMPAVKLAEALGYDLPSFIFQIEAGYKIPLDKVKTLAKALDFGFPERKEFYRLYLKEFHPDVYKLAKLAFGIINNGGGNGKSRKRVVKVVRSRSKK